MPRETRAPNDLTPEAQAFHAKEQRRQQERAKRPEQLSVPERVKRLEILMGVD